MRIPDTSPKGSVNVRFYVHTTINEFKTKAAGRPIYDEMEVCELSYPGNKTSTHVAPANTVCEWAEISDEYSNSRMEVTYAMKYNEQYLKFKSGDASSMGGTPLEELTFLSVGKRLELKALKIHSAETLAGLDGNALKMLGQGGRDLKVQAQAYLDTSLKNASATQLHEALSTRDDKIAKLEAALNSLSADKGTKKQAKSETKASEFDSFESEDIINWIADSLPDHGFTDKTPRNELIAKADEILAAQGKKKNAA
jgi:hypothetical protein